MLRTSALSLTLAMLAGPLSAAEAGQRYFQLTPTVPGGLSATVIDPATIPDSDYITVSAEGQLISNGQRHRFWAVIGNFPNQIMVPQGQTATPEQRSEFALQAYADNEALITRFQDLGFNMTRFWRANSASGDADYVPGDGSSADIIDHFVATAKAKGFRIWMASLNRNMNGLTPEHVTVVDDPDTAEPWRAAITEGLAAKAPLNRARYWDPRLEAYAISQMVDAATHVNKYTGLRWCDDPVFAAFELSNEEWWVRAMLRGDWQKLPAFLRNSLVQRWNDYLLAKYDSATALTTAWNGLLPGEDPTRGTVLFTPMATPSTVALSINDGSAHAQAAVDAMVKQEYSRADFHDQRASDVLDFLMQVQIAHKQREHDAIKPLGKATRLAPLAWDTGIGYEIQSQWVHQNAEASVHDAYVNGFYGKRGESPAPAGPFEDALQAMQAHQGWTRMVHNRDQWVSWLEKPPGIAQGVPWLEHNRVKGKPFFCYETQISQPAKYRADFPLRLTALASVQDWDIAAWHYWGAARGIGSEVHPFHKGMDYSTGSHPQGYHFTWDECQAAMMRAAGIAWRMQAWAPAANPTTFIYGRKAMTDPLSMRYAGSYGLGGMDMLPTTYQHGLRIHIDPTRDDDAVIGPVVKGADYLTHNPYTPTEQVTFDWKQGFLSMQAPAALAWTGFLGNIDGEHIAFADGSRLDRVIFANDEGIYEAMTPEEGYLAFCAYSEDGLPLAQSRHAAVSLVSTSFNDGFRIERKDDGSIQVHGGGLPVRHARVGGVFTSPAIAGMRYTLRDWHLDSLGEGTVGADGAMMIPADQPLWFIELRR